MSDLSKFAARLRQFISDACVEVPPDEQFNAMALELFALQFRANKAYRILCEARGVTSGRISSWTEIPTVPTSAFKELDLSALAPTQRTVVFHSSGTSGQRPSRHFHSADSLALYEASLLAWFAPHYGDRPLVASVPTRPDQRTDIISLTPPPAEAPHSSLVHMVETVRREFGSSGSLYGGRVSSVGAWELSSEHILACLRRAVAAARPVALLGTAFSFVHLLDFLVENGASLVLPSGSMAMETGGYKSRSRSMTQAEFHRCLSQGLGIPADRIICEYGMTELSSQAYALNLQSSVFNEAPSERVFHFPPWARARVISPETAKEAPEGESGLVQVFDLANVWSVLAIQTEDVACRRGPGFALRGRALRSEPRGCSLTA